MQLPTLAAAFIFLGHEPFAIFAGQPGGTLRPAVKSSVYAAANDARVKRGLYLNSYDRGHRWSDDIERGLLARIKQTDRNIELSVEYLDGRRFPEMCHAKAAEAAPAAASRP